MLIERTELPIDALVVDHLQSRDIPWIGDDLDQQLAASIDADGMLQDLIVRPIDAATPRTDPDTSTDGGADASPTPETSNETTTTTTNGQYAVIGGSRRLHAAIEAGEETVPCKILAVDDLQAAWQSLLENTTRRELSEQEVSQQLNLIYELVRPLEPPTSCPDCGRAVDDESMLVSHCASSGCDFPGDPTEGPPRRAPTQKTKTGESHQDGSGGNESAETATAVIPATTPTENGADRKRLGRFYTDRQAIEYIAHRYYDRTDDGAIKLVSGHLRTAQLPPELQALFKRADERTDREQTALKNYNIDTQVTLGSGEGRSGTSQEVTSLYEAVADHAASAAIDPTDAVLEAVGTLTHDEMSEQELRRSLRAFKREVVADLSAAEDIDSQRTVYREVLSSHAERLRRVYETVEPDRPFKKVDVLGPETQRHSRWHTLAMQTRDVDAHGELVRQLYQERLEALAEERGWN